MTRDSSRKHDARKRKRFTGERYQQAHGEIILLGAEDRLIPSATDPAQQLAEATVLHRLLLGLRTMPTTSSSSAPPLLINAVRPTENGLEVLVPAQSVSAFVAALSMHHLSATARPPADEVIIHLLKNRTLLITAGKTEAHAVHLRCPWNALRKAIVSDPSITVSSGKLCFDATGATTFSDEGHAALSGLMRRIGLFAVPNSLAWLVTWHQWLAEGGTGLAPQPPAGLLTDLHDARCGLGPQQLRALGIGHSAPRSEKKLQDSQDQGQRTSTYTDVSPNASLGSYKHLAITVMRLNPARPIEREYHSMTFPKRWSELLDTFVRQADCDEFKQNVTASFDAAIAALLPDLVVVQRDLSSRSEPSDAWLIAYEPVEPSIIVDLFKAAIRAQGVAPEQVEVLLAQLGVDDLGWSLIRVGPALAIELLARLIPMEVAVTLSQSGMQSPVGALTFVRCSTDQGSELVSWPPMTYSRSRRHDHYSATIGISVQTAPFNHEPLVYLTFGVRRWLPGRRQSAQEGTLTTYLSPTRPYLEGAPRSRHFGAAEIKIKPTPQYSEVRGVEPHWNPTLAGVLAQLGVLRDLPDPRELLADPPAHLYSDDIAATAYQDGMLPWHQVSDGMSIADREPLMRWVIDKLAPHLQPHSPLERATAKVYKGLQVSAARSITPEVLHAAVGPRLTIELIVERGRTTLPLLMYLSEVLGIPNLDPENLGPTETLMRLGPVTVGIRKLAIPGIHTGLVPGHDAATEAHGAHLAALLGTTTHPTISIVECSGPDQFLPRKTLAAAKSTVRHALMRTGRLCQHLKPGDETEGRGFDPREATHRTVRRSRAAVNGLFRVLGVRPAVLPTPSVGTLSERPALLAISALHYHTPGEHNALHHVPIAVLADPTGREVLTRTPGTSWLPAHETLIEIARNNMDGYTPYDSATFFESTVKHAVQHYSDTLLLTHEQKLRDVWAFLQNCQIQADLMDFGKNSPQPIATLPGLRHIRVRTAHDGETPESYGVDGVRIGQPKGLWRSQNESRLFASTSGKPANRATAMKGSTKIIRTTVEGVVIAPKPTAEVWTDDIVELLVAGLQEGDSLDHWAALAHDLRSATSFSTWMTPLPWPLDLVEQIEEHLDSQSGI